MSTLQARLAARRLRVTWWGQDAGIGTNIDSFYEYLIKAHLLFGDATFLPMFFACYQGIMAYIKKGAWYLVYTPRRSIPPPFPRSVRICSTTPVHLPPSSFQPQRLPPPHAPELTFLAAVLTSACFLPPGCEHAQRSTRLDGLLVAGFLLARIAGARVSPLNPIGCT